MFPARGGQLSVKKIPPPRNYFFNRPPGKKYLVIILGFFSVGWLAFQESRILDPRFLDPGFLDPGILDPGILDPGILVEFRWNLGPK